MANDFQSLLKDLFNQPLVIKAPPRSGHLPTRNPCLEIQLPTLQENVLGGPYYAIWCVPYGASKWAIVAAPSEHEAARLLDVNLAEARIKRYTPETYAFILRHILEVYGGEAETLPAYVEALANNLQRPDAFVLCFSP